MRRQGFLKIKKERTEKGIGRPSIYREERKAREIESKYRKKRE